MYISIKNIIFIFTIIGMGFTYAVETHVFEEKSGMITYRISGGGQLTKETNLSIKGSSKLRFKEWGNIKIEEEHGIILTTGAIKHKQEVKRFEKYNQESIITVDYENEQLLERKKAKKIVSSEPKLIKKGQEEVSGILCDIWEGEGVRQCIYKNIILKLESKVLDITYTKVAISVTFDINTSQENCLTPNFPLKEFALFKDNIKTKNAYNTDDFCKVLQSLNEHTIDIKQQNSAQNIENKERQKFINHITEDIFKHQKKILPQLLLAMKETRECLQTGENPFNANQCIEKFSEMKESLGTEKEDYIILWDKQRKAKILDKIEDEVMFLESRISCVNRAKNITDLSTCMK